MKSPCDNCGKRATCTGICEKLERFLDKDQYARELPVSNFDKARLDSGAGDHEKLSLMDSLSSTSYENIFPHADYVQPGSSLSFSVKGLTPVESRILYKNIIKNESHEDIAAGWGKSKERRAMRGSLTPGTCRKIYERSVKKAKSVLSVNITSTST